jgi:serine/threonine-protein kinase
MVREGEEQVADLVPPDVELVAGAVVGEYTIQGRLGQGGFGVVYSAVHPLIGKQVAIKVLNRQFSADPTMVSRFVAEARAVNQIRHKHIIDIFSFGQLDGGSQYYVMELLNGVTLDRYLRDRGRLDKEEALGILFAVGRALDAAHAKGIAHRDLKPENVFVADDEGLPFPKLLDFGIAKLLSTDTPQQHKTRTGAPMGTPYYMSPEQCRGRAVDHRTDIYAFGIMTYQLLTGRLPFYGEDFVEIILQQINGTPTPMSQLYDDLTPALDRAVMHMLEKDPAKRPPNVTTAVAQLYDAAGLPRPYSSAPVLAAAHPTGPSASRTPARFPTPEPPPTTVPGAVPKVTPHDATLPMDSQAAKPAPAAPAPPVPRSTQRVTLVAVGIASTAALGLMFWMLRPVAPPAPPRVPEAWPQAPLPAESATSPAAATAPATPPKVRITLEGCPFGTDVFGPGHVLLGQAPGTLTVPASEVPLELTLDKAGYATRVARIRVTEDAVVRLPLSKLAPRRGKEKTGKPKGADIPEF